MQNPEQFETKIRGRPLQKMFRQTAVHLGTACGAVNRGRCLLLVDGHPITRCPAQPQLSRRLRPDRTRPRPPQPRVRWSNLGSRRARTPVLLSPHAQQPAYQADADAEGSQNPVPKSLKPRRPPSNTAPKALQNPPECPRPHIRKSAKWNSLKRKSGEDPSDSPWRCLRRLKPPCL